MAKTTKEREDDVKPLRDILEELGNKCIELRNRATKVELAYGPSLLPHRVRYTTNQHTYDSYEVAKTL